MFVKYKKVLFYFYCIVIVGTLVYATHVTIETQVDFNAGSHTNTEYFNGALRIFADAAGSGNYTSKVIDATSSTDWQRIFWFENNFCSFCELPNFSKSESINYYDSGIDMDETIVLFHFEETLADSLITGEDFYDSGGNFLHANGSATGLTYGEDCLFGKCIKNTDSDGSVTAGFIDFPSMNALTISVWAKALSQSGTAARRLVSCQRQAVQVDCFLMFLGSTSYPRFYVEDSSGVWKKAENNSLNLEDNLWHHYVGVVDTVNNNVKLYIDGELHGEDSFSRDSIRQDLKEDLFIGASSDLDQEFNGNIDELALWARSFTAQDVEALYNRSVANFNVSVKVRTCDDVNCAGESFTNFGVSTAPLDISTLPDNQFIQFQFNLSSDTGGYSPKITYVNMTNETNDVAINQTKGTPWTLSAGTRAASETGVTIPALDFPLNASSGTDTTPKLVWNNSNNTMGEATTYRLQVATDEAFTALVVNVADIAETNDTKTEYNTSALAEDDVYYWRVRTEINGFESDWSSEFWQFEVLSSTAISLPIDTVVFGVVVAGNSYNSTMAGIQPLVVRNDGSSLVNISVNASVFFTGTDPSYKFRVEENESGAYSSATTFWANLTTNLSPTAITNLKSGDSQDEANIHILIGVPTDETAGDKTSTIEVSTT